LWTTRPVRAFVVLQTGQKRKVAVNCFKAHLFKLLSPDWRRDDSHRYPPPACPLPDDDWHHVAFHAAQSAYFCSEPRLLRKETKSSRKHDAKMAQKRGDTRARHAHSSRRGCRNTPAPGATLSACESRSPKGRNRLGQDCIRNLCGSRRFARRVNGARTRTTPVRSCDVMSSFAFCLCRV
ncbi:MAG: hypothetical protein JWN13_6470, partial [Betaproteobacteria bacterium]|nr:hypothetical protein [Betaproteobacteria bacterium]